MTLFCTQVKEALSLPEEGDIIPQTELIQSSLSVSHTF
jgi:hypothetical protein